MTDQTTELKQKLEMAITALRDLLDNLTYEETYGPYGRYFERKWTGEDYLVDSAQGTLDLLESEEQE